MLPHERRDLLVLYRTSFFAQIWLSVRSPRRLWWSWLCKTKTMCENLGVAYSSDIDGKQLCEEIQDCKMLVSSRAT